MAIRTFRGSPPRSRLHLPVWKIGLENSYPVTAAQLLPIFTEFLDSHANFCNSQRTGETIGGKPGFEQEVSAGKSRARARRALRVPQNYVVILSLPKELQYPSSSF